MGISDFGEMSRLTQMAKPDISVITNIGQCHLENLKTRDGILKAKTEIFEGMNEHGKADDMICIAAWIVEIIWSVSFHQLDCPQLIISTLFTF